MKIALTILVCLAMATTMACAQGGKVGFHGAYSVSGDVEEETAGIGVQFVAQTEQNLSIEFSVTQFNDDALLLDSITALAITGRIEAEIGETTTFYFGGGVNYNVFDYDNDAFLLAPLYEVDLDDSL